MQAKAVITLIIGSTALALIIASRCVHQQPARDEVLQSETNLAAKVEGPAPEETTTASQRVRRVRTESPASFPPPAESTPVTNKLQRLALIRETFRTLAAGDATAALRVARQLTDENERETALLTLVTEWTGGELRPAAQRARAIAMFGLEVGLGLELARQPDLALAWAAELADDSQRSVLLQQTALAVAGSDPLAALSLGQQLPPNDRRTFIDAVYAGWAENDTAAALQWADQLSEPAERDSALDSIRSVAPVGIGAAVSMRDGYPVINELLPGTPAELSGQLHPGDRIVALAQGDNSFVAAQGLPLAEVVQMIRGQPGTVLRLQVLPADATANTAPHTISVVRDQIIFKK